MWLMGHGVELLSQAGMLVCRGATPSWQGRKWVLVCRQRGVSFRHTKQNSTWQREHRRFLQPLRSCSSSRPQVGQARREGQSTTPGT